MSSELTFLILAYFVLMVVARVSSNSVLGIIVRLVEKILALLTFPGVILNVFSRRLFCAIAGVPVQEVKYLSLGNPIGYVLHGKVGRYRDAYLITIGPFLVNTAFAMAMFVLPSFNLPFIVDIPFLWLGVSFAVQALPGDGESQSLWRWTKRWSEQNPLVILGSPLAMIVASIRGFKKFLRIGLIYAGALYCVTFCLVAAVLIAGSFVLPGAYSVKIASADPAPTAAVGTQQDSFGNLLGGYPSPGKTTGHSSPYGVNAAGKEAGAKDWLSIAQDAMSGKNANAVLISVDGHSNDRMTALPLNGKCHVWQYTYASRADNAVYYVTVHDGVLEGIKTKAFSASGMEGILYKYGDPAIGSWNLDSTDVVQAAYDTYKERTGQEPASAGYRLELSCWGKLEWTIYYYDSTSRVTANIDVDPATGSLGNVWIPSSG